MSPLTEGLDSIKLCYSPAYGRDANLSILIDFLSMKRELCVRLCICWRKEYERYYKS